MNGAHLHLVMNHIPVLGAFAIVALTLLAKFKNDESLTKLNFQLMALIGLLTAPVYFTGEGAEEVLEKLPGFSEAIVERHEELGLYGLILAGILGLIGLIGLYLLRKNKAMAFSLWKGSLSVGVIFLVVTLLIANAGGEIRHTEIRKDSAEISNQ